MDTGHSGIPFLDELRRKWRDGLLSGGQALNELALWEDDAANRTGEELDAAWTLRGDIESSATVTQLIPSVPNVRAQVDTPSASAPTASQDEDVNDRIPRLRDIMTQAASARSRRDWGRIDALRTEAEELIEKYASAGGARFDMPDELADIFAGATEAQEAQRLLGEAHAARRKGDFSEAAYRLAEAARLDPRYTPISSAQQLVSDLQRAMRDLRDNSLNSPEELATAGKLARRLVEDDAAPESEYVLKRHADIEAEMGRRVNAAKQYVDADLATIEEPANLDDKLQAVTRLGTELSKIETLRPDAAYLPGIRSRSLGARRQLERLKVERDNLLPEIASLDPKKGFEASRVGSIMQRLETLSAAPLAQGDDNIDTAAQNLAHRLNAYLSSRLPSGQVDLTALQQYEAVLALAQRGPRPLSSQQVSTYSAAIQKIHNANSPTVTMPISSPGSLPPGSIPPGSQGRPGSVPPSPGLAQRGGSTPPPPRGTMPVPDRGSTPPSMPLQNPQFGTIPVARTGSTPPVSSYGSTGPIPPQYVPPHSVTQVPAKKGVPVWAWLLPLLIALGVGGYFGWSAYQGAENDKRVQAQATSTAQARATSTAIANATGTAAAAEADETATAQAQATATAEAEVTETAITEATETAVAADATATEIARLAAIVTPTIGVTGDVQGEVQSITVDYDVLEGGLKGMRIHVKFTVNNAKGVRCQATAYFSYDNGDPIKDLDGEYNTIDNQVAVSEPFTPGFDKTTYDDLQLFMPYDQLHINEGKYDLKFQVQTYVRSPYMLIDSSAYEAFTFTK